MNSRHLKIGAAVAALSLAWVATPSYAQTRERIVVTAQKIEQDLQKVPISVTAIGSAQLRVNSIINLKEIAQRAAGFTATEVSPAEPNYYIRGIGTEGINSNAAGDASVVMFIDGVYIGRGGGSNLDLFDLERVEILRGPQGTLFGKNVVGGLIHLVSRRPSDETFVEFEGSVGNYERLDFRARGNVPITDQAFASAAVLRKKREGFMFNETTGNHVDDEDSVGARVSLLFEPNDQTEIYISADFTRVREAGRPRDNVCNTAFNGGVHCVGVNPDPHIVNAITDGHLDRDVWGIVGEVTRETRWGTFTSLTAYREADFDFEDPFFSNPVSPPPPPPRTQIESINRNIEESSQVSQELRLAFGDQDDGPYWGVVGFYFLKEDIQRDERLDQRFPVAGISGVGSFPQEVESTSTAIFGQVSWEFIEDVTATVGARMTWEEKDVHLQGILVAGPGSPPPLAAPFDVVASESWDAFTPKFVLDWQVDEDMMVYLSIARGFKSGGFQGTPGNAASAMIPYDPEFAWAYEAGAKTEWFDRRLRLNASAFFIEHEDLQVSQLVPLCCVVIGNAATAEVRGFELEFDAILTEGLEANGSYTYLHAEFTDFATGAVGPATGNTLPRAPKHKVNLGLQYSTPLNDMGLLTARVDWTYQSKIFFEASNTPREVQGDYNLLDARIGIGAEDGRWEVVVWGKNLTDELIKTHIVAFAPFEQELDLYQPPRTYGLTLTWRFE